MRKILILLGAMAMAAVGGGGGSSTAASGNSNSPAGGNTSAPVSLPGQTNSKGTKILFHARDTVGGAGAVVSTERLRLSVDAGSIGSAE